MTPKTVLKVRQIENKLLPYTFLNGSKRQQTLKFAIKVVMIDKSKL